MSNGLTQLPGSVVDALKQQPATFAMIVMSFGLLAYTFYEGASFNAQRFETLKVLIEAQKEAQQLLANCTPVTHKSDLQPAEPIHD